MKIYDELVARGLIAQVTDEEEIKELINNGKAIFYIGFDPTADSLHVGHFMALSLMKRLQMAGNKPVALLGGGTGMIGDPSGRTDMRTLMTPETIQYNIECIKKQMEQFIEFGEGKAILVNNADWLLKLNYVDLLREVGIHFSVMNSNCKGNGDCNLRIVYSYNKGSKSFGKIVDCNCKSCEKS
jgi:tyrosyl-tRNA synthetase